MRLGTLLLRDAVITLSQLESALRAQVLYGGRLGTNLVELGFIDVNVLGRYLARVLDVPLAIADRFEKVSPDVITAFGRERADRYTAVPLGPEAANPDALGVAMSTPTNRHLVGQLEREIDRKVVPYVAPELRLLFYLEKHYGLKRKGRFIREGGAGGDGAARERRRSHPPHGISTPPPIRLEPRRKSATQGGKKRANRPDTVVDAESAAAQIDSATHRDQIADALLRFTIGRLSAAAIFLLRDHNAIGWRYQGNADTDIESLSLPLGGASVLQAALDARKAYCGPSVSPGRPVERELWAALGCSEDVDEMLVVPIDVKGRVVNLVYGHGFAGERINKQTSQDLANLGRRAGEAYLRIIAATKAHKR